MDNDLIEHYLELFASLGDVRAKRMFGGHGIFKEERMFALVADEVLYLKVHADTLTDFEKAGCEPFRYTRGGKSFTMSYHTCPETALQSARHMKPWAAKAWQAALATPKKPNKRKKN